MALTVAGPVGCKEGSKEGAGRGKGPLHRLIGRNWVVARFSALLGKYTSTAGAIRPISRCFRRLGRQRRPCVSSPCPQGFEPARRSTAPCRWRRAIERRLPPCSADEPPRRERHRCRVHLTVHLGERRTRDRRGRRPI